MTQKVVALIIVVLATSSFSIDSTTTKHNPFQPIQLSNNIGFFAGFVTGSGISYRRWFSPNKAVQFTMFPYYNEDRYDESNDEMEGGFIRDSGYSNHGLLSIGSNYLYCISNLSDLAIMAYGGGSLLVDYTKESYREHRTPWNETIEIRYIQKHKTKKKITLGGGLGGEMRTWRIILNFMIGLQVYYEVESKRKGINPSVEGGGFFNF